MLFDLGKELNFMLIIQFEYKLHLLKKLVLAPILYKQVAFKDWLVFTFKIHDHNILKGVIFCSS